MLRKYLYGKELGTRTPTNAFGERYATITPVPYMEAKVEYDSTSADYKTAILSVCTISPNGARRWSRPKSPKWEHYA